MDILRKLTELVREPEIAMDATVATLLLAVSLGVAIFLSLLYQFTYEDRATGSQIHRAFVLIGPAVTALFVAIQFSLPLSLGLLGALSIVRFRTPIKEPEEIGFILLLCACSIVIATLQFVLLGALLVAAVVGLLARKIASGRFRARRDGILLVSYHDDGNGAFRSIRDHCESALARCKLESIATTEDVTTAQFSFQGLTVEGLDRAHARLGGCDSVVTTDFYFSRGAALH